MKVGEIVDIGEIIKKRRIQLGLTLEDVGTLVGVGKSTVRKWENGLIENMGRDKISSLSKALNISPLVLLGLDKDEDLYNSVNIDFIRIPLYPPICCGNGGFVEDSIIEYVPVPSKGLTEHGDYFCQLAEGNSMKDAGISENDLLVFEKVPKVPSGAIGCFCTDENMAMCKKYKEQNGIIMLQPMNSECETIPVDPLNESFKCLGILRKVIKDFHWEDK